MSSFDQQLISWQPFFMTMAAVCATFAGLLFLALSLHMHEFAEAAKVNLKRLAMHTFTDFMLTLFIAVFCLIPHMDHKLLGTMLIVLTVVGFAQLRKPFMEALRDKDFTQHRGHFFIRLGISLLAHLLIIVGAVAMLQNVDTTIIDYWLLIFAGSIALLVSATRNSWYLLTHELGSKK